MIRTNCTYDDEISAWVTAALWEQVVICFIGSICNGVGIWCLCRCKITKKAVKLQLICILGLQMSICIVTLPFVTYTYYTQFFCWEDGVPELVQFFFSILNSILLQAERLNFMAMAFFRLVAVRCPRQYQKMVTMKVVISIQIGILLFIVPPWIVLGIIRKFDFPNMSGSIMRLHFDNESSFVMALYGIYYCLPFVITFITYTIMMVSIIRQNRLVKMRAKKRGHRMDHVAFTVRIVIVTNLFLDGPHVVCHILHEHEVATITTHMAFFLHLILDPIILVGMNQNYRKELIARICSVIHLMTISGDQPSDQAKEVEEALRNTDDNNGARKTWRQAQSLSSNKRYAVYVT